MLNVLRHLKKELSRRPDSEHGQAFVRLAVLSVVLVYMLVRGATGALPSKEYVNVLKMVETGFVVGAFLIAWILWRPGKSHLRRIIGMISDYGLMAAAMIHIGEPLA